MNPLRDVTLCLLTLSLTSSQVSWSQERDRSKVPEKYKWNLADIYPSEDSWKTAKDAFVKDMTRIGQFRGKAAESPESLLGCLNTVSDLSKELSRLYVYSSLLSDLDTRDSKHLSMNQQMGQIGSEFSSAAAFIQPEILRMDRATIEGYIKQEPRLEIYRHDLDDILRRKAHTGNESGGEDHRQCEPHGGRSGQHLLDLFQRRFSLSVRHAAATARPSALTRRHSTSIVLFPTGRTAEGLRGVPRRRSNEFRRTFGTQLYAEVKKDMFYAKARNYNSSLESALDGSNIPVAVYQRLVQNVNDNLATFHST